MTERFIWYEKPTLPNQKMFHLPVLGWITVLQFGILIGAGLPGMFIAVQIAGIFAAPWPLLAAFLFAKFRPPLLGYEMRLYHMMRFRMFGPKEKQIGEKPKKYVMPKAQPAPAEAKPQVDEPIEITVHDAPRELRMTLPADTPTDKRLEIRLDGVIYNTTFPDTNGTVQMVLYVDDMVGERSVTIHGAGGAQIAGRNLVFVQAR